MHWGFRGKQKCLMLNAIGVGTLGTSGHFRFSGGPGAMLSLGVGMSAILDGWTRGVRDTKDGVSGGT